MATVTIPVMAKCRIGHFAEAQILESLKVDFIDESEGKDLLSLSLSLSLSHLLPSLSTLTHYFLSFFSLYFFLSFFCYSSDTCG